MEYGSRFDEQGAGGEFSGGAAHRVGDVAVVVVEVHPAAEVAVATTAHLADRLGLPASPIDHPRALRGLLADHVMEGS